ncbi:hypothetical protein TNCT_460421 [Trichonephila clavata]|uniref:Uncharacterized protein n=1 Tax=Trichonephila clavata TaxID=2740835 RepID=A0A8X6H4Z8_TRICU|nr:hypothetical protein TNCT_460421 [Trichonephila clavata]
MGLDKVLVLPRRIQIRRHKPAGRTKAGRRHRIHQTVNAVFFLELLRIIARLSQDIMPLRDWARAISHNPGISKDGHGQKEKKKKDRKSDSNTRKLKYERNG